MENSERTFGLSLTKLLRGYSWMSGSLCFFPDGRSLAVSTEEDTLDIWDVEQQIKLSTFPLEPWQCSSMTFVPGGLRVASGGPGTIARVLSLDGGCLAEFSGHQRRIRSLVFSHDGTHLVTLDASGTLRIWHIPTNQLVLLFPTVPPEERISELSEGNPPLLVLSPDDRLLLVKWRSRSGKIQAWEVDLVQHQARWKGGFLAGEPQLNALAFSPDGRLVALTDSQGMLG
jgi:WD40 repeat protein